MSGSTPNTPRHHHYAPSLSGTSLQIPRGEEDRSKSTISSARSFDQSKSQMSFADSAWSSGSNASSTSHQSVRSSFYPTSGYPPGSMPGQGQTHYPTSGYPISQIQHSYGYPSSSFPIYEVPGGSSDLSLQPHYPTSEFPGGGMYPGELQQDDGSQPFIGASTLADSGVYPTEPLDLNLPPGGNFSPGFNVSYPTVGIVSTPTSFDPNYNLGFPGQ